MFDLRCADAQRGRELLGNVEADYYTQILPVIEEVFDGFSEDGISLEIDRLEIDLGDAGDARFEQELPERIARALRQRLSDILAGNEEGVTVKRRHSGQSDWDALLHFLQTGQTPWWVEEKAFAPWELLLDIIQSQPARLQGHLVGLSGSESHATEARRIMARIAGTSNIAVLPAILGLLLPQDHGAIGAIGTSVWGLAREIGLGESNIWQLKTALMLAAAKFGEVGTPLFAFWENDSAQPKLWESLRTRHLAGRPGPELAKPWTDWLGSKAADKPQRGKEPSLSAEALQQDATVKRPLTDSVSIGEEFFVTNAGLVLVAGFLPSYFGALDLLQGDGFRDLAAQHRAVQLLDVLARGLHIAAEHELLLNKVLCGLDLQSPLDLANAPTRQDLEAADELLAAVIGHWPVVGAISPDQLRGGFILREGWLRKGAQDWTLRVERKTYDVVLERLPWSIGVTALPWMKGKLWAEW